MLVLFLGGVCDLGLKGDLVVRLVVKLGGRRPVPEGRYRCGFCRDRTLRYWRSPGNKVDRLLLICMSPLVAVGVPLRLRLCLCNIPQTDGQTDPTLSNLSSSKRVGSTVGTTKSVETPTKRGHGNQEEQNHLSSASMKKNGMSPRNLMEWQHTHFKTKVPSPPFSTPPGSLTLPNQPEPNEFALNRPAHPRVSQLLVLKNSNGGALLRPTSDDELRSTTVGLVGVKTTPHPIAARGVA